MVRKLFLTRWDSVERFCRHLLYANWSITVPLLAMSLTSPSKQRRGQSRRLLLETFSGTVVMLAFGSAMCCLGHLGATADV